MYKKCNTNFQKTKMETKTKKQIVKSEKENGTLLKNKKSKIALFREKYPFGLGYEIVDMKAILK